MAEIKMDLTEWQEQIQKADRLEKELAEAHKKFNEAKLGPEGSDARKLAAALEHLTVVAQFAIANLDPMAYRGWPHEDLAEFARLLPDLPGVSAFIKEIANDLRIFARKAAEWEDARARGLEKEKHLAETASRAVDPATYRPEGATILDKAGKVVVEPGES